MLPYEYYLYIFVPFFQVTLPEGHKEKFTSENDHLILEDDTMRVQLIGNVSILFQTYVHHQYAVILEVISR